METWSWSTDWQPWQWEQPPLPPPPGPPPEPPAWQDDDGDTEASFHPEDPVPGDAGDHGDHLHESHDGDLAEEHGGDDPDGEWADQPQPEPEEWEDQAEPEEEAPWETHPVAVDDAAEGEQVVWDPADLPYARSDLGLQPLLRTTRQPPTDHPYGDNLEEENVMNMMQHQPQFVPDFSQQGQYKSGWMNRCILLVALFKERRYKHLEDVCNRVAGHHSIAHHVRCLQSHIRKHGDKGPALMGYRY